MRRKIEKYLAKKQGVDEASIRYTEDGRFDFMGDLEGVLNAVRGRDSALKPKKPSSADRLRTSSNQKSCSKKDRKGSHKMAPIAVTLSYMPYGMAPPPYSGIPPHTMYSRDMQYGLPGTENMRPYPPLPYNGKPMTPRDINPTHKHVPLAPKPATDNSNCATVLSPKEDNETRVRMPATCSVIKSRQQNDPASSFLTSTQKSPLTTPKPVAPLSMTLNSPGELNIHGMTPLSSLRGTFETIYEASGVFSGLSHEENVNLNKALFADDEVPKHVKSVDSKNQWPKTPREMKFAIGLTIGVSNSGCIKDMKSNRVSISPLAYKRFKLSSSSADADVDARQSMEYSKHEENAPGTATRSIHFSDAADVASLESLSASKVYSFMPSSTIDNVTSTPFRNVARTPCAVTLNSMESENFSGSSPFAASLTPIGYDWGRQLGFSPDNIGTTFTPFKSPTIANSTFVSRSGRKVDRSPLKPIAANAIPKSIAANNPNKRPVNNDQQGPLRDKATNEQGESLASDCKRRRFEAPIPHQ